MKTVYLSTALMPVGGVPGALAADRRQAAYGRAKAPDRTEKPSCPAPYYGMGLGNRSPSAGRLYIGRLPEAREVMPLVLRPEHVENDLFHARTAVEAAMVGLVAAGHAAVGGVDNGINAQACPRAQCRRGGICRERSMTRAKIREKRDPFNVRSRFGC